MNSTDFGRYLSKYFLSYIPQRTGYSENTIKSYRDTFTIFLRYCKDVLRIKPEKICFSRMSRNMVEDFLTWLEDTKKYSISTRNQRLAALHAFFRYIQIEAPEYMELCNSILSISSKKTPTVEMNYLSIAAIKELLATPDASNKEARRDLAILSLLYDSGARVQELVDVLVGDIRIKGPATIRLTGKGKKTRIIPIMPQTINIVKAYINDYGLFSESKFTSPLFFNKRQEKLTRAGISYIVNKYITAARKKHPELFPNRVSPHIFRHSKAMHLLESGVNLIYIRDFLGHSSVTTTEIYAKSNPEVKRKAIEQASHNVIPDEKLTKKEKDDLLNWLKELI
ncbi:site-specific integrase [Bacillus dakarensis]|uniref:site-specific integrase n=1 Tax=Robertmurraya dakarensis TaxID=1926278 RepID=UPI000980B133|nr:site-specific integrase [Bacillus dakarensis]